MMLVPFVQNIKYLTEFNDTTFKITQCNLHKSETHWCIPRVRKGKGRGLIFQRPIVSHIKMEGTPPWLQHKYTKIRLFLRNASSFAPKWSLCSEMEQLFYLFGRFDALLQGFLFFLLRSILSEPGDEKPCLRGFWPVKIQSGLLSYRC